jgi:peroxin-6
MWSRSVGFCHVSIVQSLRPHTQVDCYETLDESPGTMEGTLLARLEKAQNCAPCVLLLRHIEALGRKESSQKRGKGIQASIVEAIFRLTRDVL